MILWCYNWVLLKHLVQCFFNSYSEELTCAWDILWGSTYNTFSFCKLKLMYNALKWKYLNKVHLILGILQIETYVKCTWMKVIFNQQHLTWNLSIKDMCNIDFAWHIGRNRVLIHSCLDTSMSIVIWTFHRFVHIFQIKTKTHNKL